MRPKKNFWIQTFFGQTKFFDTKILGIKVYLELKIFINKKLFWTQILYQKFLDYKFYWTKNIFKPNCFFRFQIIFGGSNVVLGPILFLLKLFWQWPFRGKIYFGTKLNRILILISNFLYMTIDGFKISDVWNSVNFK